MIWCSVVCDKLCHKNNGPTPDLHYSEVSNYSLNIETWNSIHVEGDIGVTGGYCIYCSTFCVRHRKGCGCIINFSVEI